eukprot:21311-Lingulodinium_polyedra.AAC.1
MQVEAALQEQAQAVSTAFGEEEALVQVRKSQGGDLVTRLQELRRSAAVLGQQAARRVTELREQLRQQENATEKALAEGAL